MAKKTPSTSPTWTPELADTLDYAIYQIEEAAEIIAERNVMSRDHGGYGRIAFAVQIIRDAALRVEDVTNTMNKRHGINESLRKVGESRA